MATLTFLGGAGDVTGSCYLIETERSRVLMECGMFQGPQQTEALNRRAFDFDPKTIDAVVVSHAHLDHSGLLPKLVGQGYQGPIYSTPATGDLLELMLKDAAYLEQKDVDWENKMRRRAGKETVEPLYNLYDVEQTLRLRRSFPYGERRVICDDVALRFRDAGHILGSAIVELWIDDPERAVKLVFSGDLGNKYAYLMRDPEVVERADVLLLESTYGDRDHRPLDATVAELEQILDTAAGNRGNVIIPAFAVGRTQEILYLLGQFYQDGRLRQQAVFLDSPMAIAATDIYHKHMTLFAETETSALRRAGADNLHDWLPILRLSHTAEDSMAINRITGGAVIIAGSGMCTGGRIRHHFKHNLWRSEAHVVIVGFQARGTLGRALVDGATHVKVLGNEIAVKAGIHTLGGFSAHAGQRQLIDWAGAINTTRPRTYLVHGEPQKSQALRQTLRNSLGWESHLPNRGETIEL